MKTSHLPVTTSHTAGFWLSTDILLKKEQYNIMYNNNNNNNINTKICTFHGFAVHLEDWYKITATGREVFTHVGCMEPSGRPSLFFLFKKDAGYKFVLMQTLVQYTFICRGYSTFGFERRFFQIFRSLVKHKHYNREWKLK